MTMLILQLYISLWGNDLLYFKALTLLPNIPPLKFICFLTLLFHSIHSLRYFIQFSQPHAVFVDPHPIHQPSLHHRFKDFYFKQSTYLNSDKSIKTQVAIRCLGILGTVYGYRC